MIVDDRITMAAARVNAGLTQADIAEQMHVSRNTIHLWETGKVIPGTAQFEMFARLCSRPPEKIFLPAKAL